MSPVCTCPKCGAQTFSGSLEGLCPKCVAQAVFSLFSAAQNPVPIDPSISVTEKAGEHIGHYKLLEQIGEGGCGVVYMAEQEQPIRRQVALKVIKLGMDTRQVVARFEAERQALALMDHPNIAKVLDAGATDAGRPYFVMELVRGIRITDYCNQRKLPTRERLALFIQVCHAIQHAHQKGIIHRDIKPSNILVTMHDDVPVPKVIDFGIAKATTGQQLSDKTLFTAFAQFIGTPAYMSPEQAELSGFDIDTRSDIYSLGMLLYELLTGQTPFDAARLCEMGLDEVRRIIREEEPPRPSTRLSTLDPAAQTTVAACRRTEPPGLINLVRGDLDWIVMKTLEKDRTRRYETAASLTADIQRFLSNEPVTARPPSIIYRLQKLAQRNKFAFGSAAAVAIAILIGFSVSTWFFFKEKAARRKMESQAYLSDIALASRTANMNTSLGSVAKILSVWKNRRADLCGWEWHYLNGLCHQESLTIQCDQSELSSVTWSPDGQRLATGGTESSVKVWDAQSGNLIQNLKGHTGSVLPVAWHPKNPILASGSTDGTLRIWDLSLTQEVATLRGHVSHVTCAVWSPNGEKLASGSSDLTIKLWDVKKNVHLSSIKTKQTVRSLSWSPDSERIVGASSDGRVKVWEAGTGVEVFELGPKTGTGWRATAAWSPNNKWIATGGDDFTLKIWDAHNGAKISSRWDHLSAITAVAWKPDSTLIASTSPGEGTIKIWEPYATNAKALRIFRGHVGGARHLLWSPDGSRLASAGSDGTAKIWQTDRPDSSHTILRKPDQIVSLDWHPNGKTLASGGLSSSALIWNVNTAKKTAILKGTNWAVAWSPKGKHLATGGDDGFVRIWDENAVELWRLADRVKSLAWSPDGDRLVLVGGNKHVRIWDTVAKELVMSVELSKGHISAAWSPDGQMVAVGGDGIRVVRAENGQERWAIRGHSESVRAIAWSPDGKKLATASEDGMAKIWDAENGREIHTLLGHAAAVYAVAWSPDGRRLATGSWDRTVKLWHPIEGTEICSLAGHSNQVSAVAWSRDGRRIASGDLGGRIIVFDAGPAYRADVSSFQGAEKRIKRFNRAPKPGT